MSNKGKSDTKIVLIIAIIAAAAAAVVLFIILTGGLTPFDKNETDTDADEVVIEAEPEPDDEIDFTDDENVTGGGKVVFDYNDPTTYLPSIPDPKALDEMFILLEGFWITYDSPFVGFAKDGGEHWIMYGLWETGYGINGKIIDGHATGKYEVAIDILVPAQAATEIEDARPARAETIYIDLTDLVQKTIIKVKIENLGDGGWVTYEFGGNTAEQALNEWSI